MAAIWHLSEGWQAFNCCICRHCDHARLCEQATCHRRYCLVWKPVQLRCTSVQHEETP